MSDIEVIQPIPRQDPIVLIETDELVEGGPSGAANKQAIAIANNLEFVKQRTYAKDEIDSFNDELKTQIVTASKGLVFFEKEEDLLSSHFDDEEVTAQALDTKKIYIWKIISLDGESPVVWDWIDTGASDLELAKEFTTKLIKPAVMDSIIDKNGFVIAELAGTFFKYFVNLQAKSLETEHFSAVDDGTQEITIRDGFGFYGDLSEFLSLKKDAIDRNDFDVINDSSYKLTVRDGFGFYGELSEIFYSENSGKVEPRKDVDISQPLFSKKLAFWADERLVVSVPFLLKDREKQITESNVLATLFSSKTEFSCTSDIELVVDKFSNLGSESFLFLRDKQNQSKRSKLTIKCCAVPTGNSTRKIKVHAIGDSISNRGGLYFTHQFLEKNGYSADFIGTMYAADSNNASGTEGAYLGECREGWETGDFTFKVTNRVNIVSEGAEAEYLTFNKNTKWTHNPYLRAATSEDSESIVRNGYVFDFNFYLNRFNLDVPEVVYIGLGTNDIRDLDEPTLSVDFYENLFLMISQIRKVSNNIKIILSIPGTSMDVSRGELWGAEYVPVIQALQKLSLNIDNCLLMPAWVINSQEAGYSFSVESVDPVSGAEYGGFSDAIHPIGASRYQIFNYLAANIVATANNLI